MEQAIPSKTALSVALRRAAHQIYDSPIVFNDPIAVAILGSTYAEALRRTPLRPDRPFSTALRAFIDMIRVPKSITDGRPFKNPFKAPDSPARRSCAPVGRRSVASDTTWSASVYSPATADGSGPPSLRMRRQRLGRGLPRLGRSLAGVAFTL